MCGQTYDALWQQVEKASNDDLPKTRMEVLAKIKLKAAAEHAYGHLLKASLCYVEAQASVAPDSLRPEVGRLEEQENAASDKVLKAAEGISPKMGDRVKVHYVGSLLDGTEFDNSVKRGEPLEFPVSAVIEGWQDLLMTMKEGMKVKAWIPSALAYGEAGVPPLIPANALLVFEVELLKVYAENPVIDSTAVVPAAPADSAATKK
jgi:FKBP-type peptidyl-prolyl cis-trans isomerase